MIRDALLAIGLLLTTAGQLRFPGLPLDAIGPGEVCLALWVALSLAYEAGRLGPPPTPALTRLLMFWLVFAFAQSVGLFQGLATEEFRDTGSCLHDMLAYVLVASVSCLAVVMPDSERRFQRVSWITVAVGAVCIAALIAAGMRLFTIPGVEPWWNGWSRLRGWSDNPNQFGLLCSALLILSLHLVETARKPVEGLAALLCSIPIFLGGILTQSDSFILVVLIAGPMILGMKLWVWLFSAGRRLSLRTAFASLLVLAVPGFLVAATPFAPAVFEHAEQFVVETMEKNDQAENRFKLWSEALEIGINAHMLGLGPGPHLVNKQWKRPPPDKFEAHFVILDLFLQGGLLASLSYVWLVATTFMVACRAGLASLTALIFTLFVFSMFHHFIFRHPIFWFSVALCLAAGEGARAMKRASEREPLRCA
jgi:O-antigen ligase/polysaccharide polymerase Wzy-like membrane protein